MVAGIVANFSHLTIHCISFLLDPTEDRIGGDLLQLEVCGAKVAEQLLDALVALGIELVVGLLLRVLELLVAGGADKALGVELVARKGAYEH